MFTSLHSFATSPHKSLTLPLPYSRPAIQNIGWKTYIIFAILNACWVPVIYVFYPETKGLELEDVDRIFATKHIGFGRPDRHMSGMHSMRNERGGSVVDELFHEKNDELYVDAKGV
jgi:hypothetical protein